MREAQQTGGGILVPQIGGGAGLLPVEYDYIPPPTGPSNPNKRKSPPKRHSQKGKGKPKGRVQRGAGKRTIQKKNSRRASKKKKQVGGRRRKQNKCKKQTGGKKR